jgi:hypothetical protein
MKRIIVLSLCLFSGLVQAQNTDPIKWSFTLSSKEIHVGDTVEIVASATIIPDWYLYSNDFDKDLGPTLTQFDFEERQRQLTQRKNTIKCGKAMSRILLDMQNSNKK